jgi:cathepsin E
MYADTMSPAANTRIPTVTDNLFSQGMISAHEIGISFKPLTQDNELNGDITWGVYNY